MDNEKKRREGMKRVSDLVSQAKDLLDEAKRVAEETGNSFQFTVGKPSAGTEKAPETPFESSTASIEEVPFQASTESSWESSWSSSESDS